MTEPMSPEEAAELAERHRRIERALGQIVRVCGRTPRVEETACGSWVLYLPNECPIICDTFGSAAAAMRMYLKKRIRAADERNSEGDRG